MANGTSITLYEELNRCDNNDLAQVLARCGLGDMFTVQEWDSGTVAASATFQPPAGMLLCQSVRIVTSGTAASVGSYLPSDSNAVMVIPPGGASLAAGVCQVSADGTTITLPNTATRIVVRYLKKTAQALTTQLA